MHCAQTQPLRYLDRLTRNTCYTQTEVCAHTLRSHTPFGASEAVALEADGAPPASLGLFPPRSWVLVTDLAQRQLRRVLVASGPSAGTLGRLSLLLTRRGSQCPCSHSNRCLPSLQAGVRGSGAPSSRGRWEGPKVRKEVTAARKGPPLGAGPEGAGPGGCGSQLCRLPPCLPSFPLSPSPLPAGTWGSQSLWASVSWSVQWHQCPPPTAVLLSPASTLLSSILGFPELVLKMRVPVPRPFNYLPLLPSPSSLQLEELGVGLPAPLSLTLPCPPPLQEQVPV